jgi:hypothetical protein
LLIKKKRYMKNITEQMRRPGGSQSGGSMRRPGGGSAGGGVSGQYHNCPTGPYTQGCKSEVIRKVQGCIGVKDDSFFGPKTQGALESKGFKNGFTDADVSKLCVTASAGGTVVGGDTPDGSNSITPSNLPGWASCLKSIKNVKITQDNKGNEIVTFPFEKDNGYFWKEGKFLYVETSKNEKIYGEWSCKNNSLVITTQDGQIWTTGSGWRAQVSSSVNPEQNFKTTEVSADDYSMTEEEQPKPNPINLNQKESYMNNLENVINEVNDLISEQPQEIIQAPKDELLKLQNDPFLKAKGTLVALCRSKNQTSLPVNVNNKIYFQIFTLKK